MDRKTLVAGATGAAVLVVAALVGCAVGVRRDLAKVPPREVIFDDQCHVQDYFDDVARGRERPPALVHSDEIQTSESEKTLGGRSAYLFEENSSLPALRRLLLENWKPLPAAVMTASQVEVEVRWAEKLSTRWAVADENVELRAAGKTIALAPHPCLTAFLFGRTLFERRRELVGLPPLSVPPDAGVADRMTSD
ncbi:MAG TPA: hypothetical protein VJ860_07100 [Polyangia bacterium]|jgi:hypothetical protein|nr:hypothetical protein [Polyangia bacterium]